MIDISFTDEVAVDTTQGLLVVLVTWVVSRTRRNLVTLLAFLRTFFSATKKEKGLMLSGGKTSGFSVAVNRF